MRHLPFNHSWEVLSYYYGLEPDDTTVFARHHDTTGLNLMCKCGRMKSQLIAHRKMGKDEIDTYILKVYGQGAEDDL